MKENLIGAMYLTVVLFAVFPWLIGVVDAVAWMFGAAQVSSIHWSGGQGFLAVAWPVLWMMFICFCMG